MLSRICILLLAVLVWTGCDTDRYSYGEGNSSDSTDTSIDTLVSDVSWEEDFEDDNPYYGEEEASTSSYNSSDQGSSESRGGGGGGVPDNDEDVIKYQNYERSGDSPQELANALIYPAIRMVYSDNFARPRAKILNSSQDGDRHTIDLRITWKDHWVSQYRINGTLTVNTDGSDANFVITDKNTEAEVLELTEDNVQNELRLPSL